MLRDWLEERRVEGLPIPSSREIADHFGWTSSKAIELVRFYRLMAAEHDWPPIEANNRKRGHEHHGPLVDAQEVVRIADHLRERTGIVLKGSAARTLYDLRNRETCSWGRADTVLVGGFGRTDLCGRSTR